MTDSRQAYSDLLSKWLHDWSQSGKPSQLAYPTLKTFLLNEVPPPRNTVLGGRQINIQPILESILNGEEIETIQEEKQLRPSTLEIACGLGAGSRSDVLLAKVAAYASELSRDEANATALSSYFFVLTPPEQIHDISNIFSPKEITPENFKTMRRYLVEVMGEEQEYFLTRFFSLTLTSFNVRHNGKVNSFLACTEFWFEYCEWRDKLSSSTDTMNSEPADWGNSGDSEA